MSGKFVTVEGVEGVGKTTQITFIQEFLKSKNIDLVTTREPGGTKVGEQIRDIVLAKTNNTLHPYTELLLMFAARVEHIDKVIHPALQHNQWVLCDRFIDASYAYQGGGRGIPKEHIQMLEAWTVQELEPDLTLLLDAEVEVGLQRAKSRMDSDRFENENKHFFEKVRKIYLERANKDKKRFRIIDCSQSVEVVKKNIINCLQIYLDQAL